MLSSIPGSTLTVGQVLAKLRWASQSKGSDLYAALNTTSSTYLKIERDQRDLSFLMALRLCQFYQLYLHKFISSAWWRHDFLTDQEVSIEPDTPTPSLPRAKDIVDAKTLPGYWNLQTGRAGYLAAPAQFVIFASEQKIGYDIYSLYLAHEYKILIGAVSSFNPTKCLAIWKPLFYKKGFDLGN